MAAVGGEAAAMVEEEEEEGRVGRRFLCESSQICLLDTSPIRRNSIK